MSYKVIRVFVVEKNEKHKKFSSVLNKLVNLVGEKYVFPSFVESQYLSSMYKYLIPICLEYLLYINDIA